MSLFDENEVTGTNPEAPKAPETTPETAPTAPEATASAKVETKEEAKARIKAEKEAEKAAKAAQKAIEDEANAELDQEEKEAKEKEEKSKGPRYKEGVKPVINGDKEMRDYLMSYPKVMVMIPLMPGEKPGSTEPVIVNGVRLNILKGSMVSIPKPFADLVFNHYNIGQLGGALGAESRIDGNLAKETALN